MKQDAALPGPLDRTRQDGLVLPDYDGYCFVNVPGTAAATLGVDVGPTLPPDVFDASVSDVAHVVVLLVDGLGWHRFHRDAGTTTFFDRLRQRTRVTPLTSVLPASTASAITTVHTAAPPANHGVVGWDVRLPSHDTIVEIFPHELRGQSGADAAPPIDACEVVEADPIYPTLEQRGVRSRVIQPAGTLGTEYANATFRGATQVPYETVEVGASELADRLATSAEPSYSYLYAADIDSASHAAGVDSAAYHDALDRIDRALSEGFLEGVSAEIASETLLVVAADHGMIDLPPGPDGCLDVTDLEAVDDALERSPDGAPVMPWGDYRGLHLAVQQDRIPEARAALEAHGVRVLTREHVLDYEFYGPEPGAGFEQRCGDLVCFHPDRKLTYPGRERVVEKIGMHGGPTEREMIVPFASARLSALQGDAP